MRILLMCMIFKNCTEKHYIVYESKMVFISLFCDKCVKRDTRPVWPCRAEAPYRADLYPEDDHMHGSYCTGSVLQYLRKHTEESYVGSCSSVKLKPCFVWLASWIKASGKLVILLLYSGKGVHMKAWSLYWPVLDTGLLCPETVLPF